MFLDVAVLDFWSRWMVLSTFMFIFSGGYRRGYPGEVGRPGGGSEMAAGGFRVMAVVETARPWRGEGVAASPASMATVELRRKRGGEKVAPRAR